MTELTDEQVKVPTEEEIFELIEWCGFKHVIAKCGEYWIKVGISRILFRTDLLEMTNSDNLLGFLFKHAVPKLMKDHTVELITMETGTRCTIYDDFGYSTVISDKMNDSGLSLFRAIWGIIHDK